MNKLERVLETIARAYGYPFEWIKDAYMGGLQNINDIIDYCEARLEIEKEQEKPNEAK